MINWTMVGQSKTFGDFTSGFWNLTLKDVSMLTYSDLVDEIEAVFPHLRLSSQLRVESGHRLGFHARLGLIFSDGRSLLEGVGKRNSGGVFTRQVAHLAHQSGLGVYKGAELTHPLWKRKKRSEERENYTREVNKTKHSSSAVRQTCLSVSAGRDPGLGSTGATGGRVARRGRSHTSQRMLLP